MRKFGVVLAAVACLMLTALAAQAATATPAEDMKGQIGINAAGGITMPMGALADEDNEIGAKFKMGWDVVGGLDYFITPAIGIGADFGMGSMKLDVDDEDVDVKAKTINFGLHAKYMIPTGGPVVPYLQLGAGMYNRKIESSAGGLSIDFSDTKPGINAGVGVGYKMNEMIAIGVNGTYHYPVGKFEPEIGGEKVEVLKDWNYLAFNAGVTFFIKPAAK